MSSQKSSSLYSPKVKLSNVSLQSLLSLTLGEYRLLLLTILTNLTGFSIQQYCHEEFAFNFLIK
jgi:hypothetical protein